MKKKQVLKALFKSKVESLKAWFGAWWTRNHATITAGLAVFLLVLSVWSLAAKGFYESVHYLALFSVISYTRISFKEIENTYQHTVDSFNDSIESIDSELGYIRDELIKR